MKNTNNGQRLHLYLKQAKSFKGKVKLQQKMQKGLTYTAAGIAAMGLMPIEVHAQVVCSTFGAPTPTGTTSYAAPGYDFDGDGAVDAFINTAYNATQWLVLEPGNNDNVIYFHPMGNNPLIPAQGLTFPASPYAANNPYVIEQRDFIVTFPLSGPAGGVGFVTIQADDTDPNVITLWGTDLTATIGSDIVMNSNSLTECPQGTALPVELISFTARATTASIALNWQTASEENNAGFEIERSTDGKNFTFIGFEKGIGTTAELQNYSFEDKETRAGQRYYYRLKQIDFDGAFEYSDIVQTEIEGKSLNVAFSPNPSQGKTQLDLFADSRGQLSINIFDASGKEILNTVQEVEKGDQRISLDLAGLPKGLYFAKIALDGALKYDKLIID